MSNDIKDLDEIVGQENLINLLLQKSVQLSALSNDFPSKEEMQFYKRIPSSNKIIKDVNKTLLSAIQTVARFCGNPIESSGVTLRYSGILDGTDRLLENVDVALDQIRDINTKTNVVSVLQTQAVPIVTNQRDIEKSQIHFKDSVDNSAETPFLPKIKEKLHAAVPMPHLITDAQTDFSAFVKTLEKPETFIFPHPYAHEINSLEYSPEATSTVFETQQPIAFLNENLLYVDELDTMQELIKHLRETEPKEIAIDLEHHNLRSYQGFTCLMQLSTRTKDFIIDTLKMREHMYLLNEFFANPKITKVLHGADSDIKWLQKDFGLYVVNMFDTGQAARFLNLPSYSLAHLLMKYCKVSADKKYQLADWRMRPIPKEMLKYAREDTHYLLYIYDLIRKDIIKFALDKQASPEEYLKSVLNKSKELTLRSYTKPAAKDDDYYSILSRHKMTHSAKKVKILKKLWKWRDSLARLVDESPKYILPNNVYFQLVEARPKTITDLLRNFKTLSMPVRSNVQELIDLLNNDMEEEEPEQPEVQPEAAVIHKKQPVKHQEQEYVEPAHLKELTQQTFKLLDFETSIRGSSSSNNTITEEKVRFADAFGVNKRDSKRDNQLAEIQQQFNHMTITDALLSFYPHISKEKIKNKMEENKRKEQEMRLKELEEEQVTQANVKEAVYEGVLEFSKDRTEELLAQQARNNKKELSLNLKPDQPKDKNGDDYLEIPAPLKDSYNISLNKRRRGRGDKFSEEEAKFNSRVKKIKMNKDEAIRIEKMDNQFAPINTGNSSGEEDNERRPMKAMNNYKKEAGRMKDLWSQLSTRDFSSDPTEIVSNQFENDKKKRPKPGQNQNNRMKPPRQR